MGVANYIKLRHWDQFSMFGCMMLFSQKIVSHRITEMIRFYQVRMFFFKYVFVCFCPLICCLPLNIWHVDRDSECQTGCERWFHFQLASWRRTSLAGSRDSYLYSGGMAGLCPLSCLVRSLGFQGNGISSCDPLCRSSHRLNRSTTTFVIVTLCHPVHRCSAFSCGI